MNNHQRVPPNNPEAEIAVLGSILLDYKCIPKVAKILKPSDFYSEANAVIFKTMVQLFRALKAVDVLTVSNRLEDLRLLDKCGGSSYLAQCVNQTPSSSSVVYYARIIKNKAKLRNIITLGYGLTESGFDESKDPEAVILEAGQKLIDQNENQDDEATKIADAMKEYEALQELYSEAYKNGKEILGTTTGFKFLDEMTEGFREQHLWVIGGYTSVGKTYFSLNIVHSLLKNDQRVVYYSLEMSKVDIISRLLAIITGMPPGYILKGLMDPQERMKFNLAKEFLRNCDFTIHCHFHNLKEIKMSMLEEMMKKKVDVFFLDYIQLVSLTGKEYDDMRIAATEFQALMKKFSTPLVLLSQISNEAAKSPNSTVIGLKGASNIAQAADYVLELWPGTKDIDQYRKDLAEGNPVLIKCQIKKNRNGRSGTIYFKFNSYTGEFSTSSEIGI